MKNNNIPFNRTDSDGNELKFVQEAIESAHISGNGKFTHKCNFFLEKVLNVNKSLLTTSCTHALEMTAILLDIKPGDKVILPSFTFVSTANAFVLRGAEPIFIDIRKDTLNMDESKLEELISPEVKAIIPVHYAGVGCEMDTILQLAKKYKIAVIEDNAHGLFGKYKNKYLGTFGDFSTQSFHETKNFSCGEGGALIINNKKYIELAEVIHDKGTNRSKFFRGEVDKYSWVNIGSSFLPSDILAAFLFAQFEKRELINKKRELIWTKYFLSLSDWAQKYNISLPFIPDYCEQTYHMFYLMFDSKGSRDKFIIYMKNNRIPAIFHYIPLHNSLMGKKYSISNCPITESVSDRIVRLPFFNGLKEDMQDYIINKVLSYYKD